MLVKTHALFLLLLFSAFVLIGMKRAEKKGYQNLKTIPGMPAFREAIGRATELGRPIHFTGGWNAPTWLYAISGIAMLPYIAKMANEFDAHLIVTTPQPVTFAIYDDILRTTYAASGKPESDIDLRFLAGSSFAYVAACQGMMLREKPAAQFLMGLTDSETLIHAEAGTRVGAFQIGGTGGTWNLPFMAVTCEYTLLGEEFLTASAIVSEDLSNLGSVVGQDWAKVIVIVFILVGGVLAQAGVNWLAKILFP